MEKRVKTHARRVLLQQIAPEYQQAAAPEKQCILQRFMAETGYVRKYAVWLLNHAEEGVQTVEAPGRRYGTEVEAALVLAWQTLNRICAKRLIPFLPEIITSLELAGHLQLSEDHRRLLLSMSAATADRLLRAYRQPHPRGVSTTTAGPLLKQQIPIRTFRQWDEAQPGLPSGGPGRPLWRTAARRLPLYADPHRCRHWLDRMFAPCA
jgi:hypothetical protein